MVKILQVLGSYMPAAKFGGANRVMYSYANILSERYRVEVITTDAKDKNGRIKDFEKLAESRNFRVNYHRVHSPYLTSEKNLTLSISFWLSILRNVKNYSHCHLAEFRGLTVFFVKVALYLNRDVKLIHSGFGMLGELNNKSFIKTALVSVYDKIFTPLLIKRIDLALVESELEVLEYRRFGYSGPYVVMPHCVVRSEMEQAIVRERDDFNLSPLEYNLVSVTRIHASKGILNAVKLVAQLNIHSKQRRYKLTICGNDEGALQQVVDYVQGNDLNDQVKIIPPCYTEERFLLYSAADAFVLLPDQNLQTSLASIEALTENCFIINNENSYIAGLQESGAGCTLELDGDIDFDKLIFALDNAESKPKEFYQSNMSSEVVRKILFDSVFFEQ